MEILFLLLIWALTDKCSAGFALPFLLRRGEHCSLQWFQAFLPSLRVAGLHRHCSSFLPWPQSSCFKRMRADLLFYPLLQGGKRTILATLTPKLQGCSPNISAPAAWCACVGLRSLFHACWSLTELRSDSLISEICMDLHSLDVLKDSRKWIFLSVNQHRTIRNRFLL